MCFNSLLKQNEPVIPSYIRFILNELGCMQVELTISVIICGLLHNVLVMILLMLAHISYVIINLGVCKHETAD